MNGKGDTPRPLTVPRKTWNENWETAFGKNKNENKKDKKDKKQDKRTKSGS